MIASVNFHQPFIQLIAMLWLESLHLIFMVTWFAGLFYLPRLFVYHSLVDIQSDQIGNERFQTMERKLFRWIMTPGAVLTLTFGAWMMLANWDFYIRQSWMTAKLALVLALLAYHVWCSRLVARFAQNSNCHGDTWYRWFNEIPTVLLIAVVLLAVVKPWQ